MIIKFALFMGKGFGAIYEFANKFLSNAVSCLNI